MCCHVLPSTNTSTQGELPLSGQVGTGTAHTSRIWSGWDRDCPYFPYLVRLGQGLPLFPYPCRLGQGLPLLPLSGQVGTETAPTSLIWSGRDRDCPYFPYPGRLGQELPLLPLSGQVGTGTAPTPLIHAGWDRDCPYFPYPCQLGPGTVRNQELSTTLKVYTYVSPGSSRTIYNLSQAGLHAPRTHLSFRWPE